MQLIGINRLMTLLKKTALHGDLFFVPAINNDGIHGYVIGRFIEATPEKLGYLIEIFKKFYTIPPDSINDIDLTKRLFRPILTSLSFINIPRWHIAFHDPNYDKLQSNYNEIGFAFNTSLWLGGKDVPLPKIAINFTNLQQNDHRSKLFGVFVYILKEYSHLRICIAI